MASFTVYMITELTAIVRVEAEDFETAEELAFNVVPSDPLPARMSMQQSIGRGYISYDTAGAWEPAGGWNEDTDEVI